MSTWLNRGASGGPCGEQEEEDQNPSRSDSHQLASTKAGVIQISSPRVMRVIPDSHADKVTNDVDPSLIL